MSDKNNIKVKGRCCSIVSLETSFLVQTTLGDFQKQLPENSFIKTHKNYIVNMNKLEKAHRNENHIVWKGGKDIYKKNL